ncbi:uncharacterized protein YmfQ (DUF2313 family) [Agrobacterium vitis]|nr:uncharacterized protein YmfQ (DUF2313 family) [Agrobacterium vitis]MBE1437088.1 uncharacterized protein YmfQ (DUF2313 family) [Agrobacterium vitis]
MARDSGTNTRTTLASTASDITALAAPTDALANPSNDDLIGAALSLWPVGAAWGSPDGQAVSLSSTLANFTRVLISPFEWLYNRAFVLARESSVFGAYEMLDAWEVEYGLPDSCVSGEASVAERLRALEVKVGAVATITPGDFIRLAASYGFEIVIEEPAVFECGFSECGGEHACGHPLQEVYWIVYVANVAVDYFRVGESQCGQDPLFDYGDAERLLCVLRKIAPAWTIPVLSID